MSHAYTVQEPEAYGPGGIEPGVDRVNFGGTMTQVEAIKLPAGTYIVTATGQVGNAADDSTQNCQLQSGGSIIQWQEVDTFHVPLFSDRQAASDSFSLSGPVVLSGAGSVEVDCNTTDPSTTPDGFATGVNMTAIQVDALN
jgi:hypothetical protein